MTLFLKTKININNLIQNHESLLINENGLCITVQDIHGATFDKVDDHTMKISRTDNKTLFINVCDIQDIHMQSVHMQYLQIYNGSSLTIDPESINSCFLNMSIMKNANVTILKSSIIWSVNRGVICKDMSIINSIVCLYDKRITIPINVENGLIGVWGHKMKRMLDSPVKFDEGETVLVIEGDAYFEHKLNPKIEQLNADCSKWTFDKVKNYTKRDQMFMFVKGMPKYSQFKADDKIIDIIENVVAKNEDGIEFLLANEPFEYPAYEDHDRFVVYGAKHAYYGNFSGIEYMIFVGDNDLVLERIDDICINGTEYQLRFKHKIEKPRASISTSVNGISVPSFANTCAGADVSYIDDIADKLDYHNKLDYSNRIACSSRLAYYRHQRQFEDDDKHYVIMNLRNKLIHVKKSGIVFTNAKSLLDTIFSVNVKENSTIVLSENDAKDKSNFNRKLSMFIMRYILGYSDLQFAVNISYQASYSQIYDDPRVIDSMINDED